jgi:hypothetical protein
MMFGKNQGEEFLDSSQLLEKFLLYCQVYGENTREEDYTYSYIADTIASIYYYRCYDSCEEFLFENADCIDSERAEWVKYMWRTLDSMTEEQRAEVVIESLNQLPEFGHRISGF